MTEKVKPDGNDDPKHPWRARIKTLKTEIAVLREAVAQRDEQIALLRQMHEDIRQTCRALRASNAQLVEAARTLATLPQKEEPKPW